MSLDAKRQRFQAAQNKKTIERASDCADRVLQKRNLISELLLVSEYNNTAHQIGMPVQIFRRRMHNDVEPRFNWSLNPWSCERVVTNRNQFPFARDLRDRVKIDQLEQRIARGLDPNHARVCFDCPLKIFRVGQIDIGEIKIGRAPAYAIEQAECAAIQIVAPD